MRKCYNGFRKKEDEGEKKVLRNRLRDVHLRRGAVVLLCLALCVLLCSCSFSLEQAMIELKAYVNGTEIEAPPEDFVESRENGTYSYDVYTDYVVLTGYLGPYLYVRVPSMIDDLPVTKIGELAFYYGAAVETVILPNTVTELAENAFYYCRALTKVVLPASVTTIGDKCFSWCESLESVILPEAVTAIPDYCFNECKSLTDITLPKGLTSVGTRAFSGCAALESLSFGDGVASVGSLAFRDCTALTALRLPGPCMLGDNVFQGCSEELTVTTERASVCWRFCVKQDVNVTPDDGSLPLPGEDTSENGDASDASDVSETSEES